MDCRQFLALICLSTLSLVALPAQNAPGRSGPPQNQPGRAAPAGSPASPEARRPGGPLIVARQESRSTLVTTGGRLTPLRRISQTAGIAGVVDTIAVSPGAWVQAGDPLLSIVRNIPGETYLPVVVRARMTGRVADIKVQTGTEVTAGTEVASLLDDSVLALEAWLSDRDAEQVRANGVREVTARTADGQTLKGSLVSISLEPDYQTGLFTCRFRFGRSNLARAGLMVFVDLPLAQVRGVFVPRQVLQRRFGRTLLWVVNDQDRLELRPVQTGPLFGNEICLTDGIAPGERYLRSPKGNEKEGDLVESASPATGGGSR